MSQWSTLGQLRLLTHLDDNAARDALPFCASALAQLSPLLKDGVSPDDPRVDAAAASIAHYMLLMHQESIGDDIAVFKAGDISVHKNERAKRIAMAATMRDNALAAAQTLFRDTGFAADSVAYRRDEGER
ncbi:MAG: hypothetical protein LBB67_00210 [Oscillospiraceae bacterium]|jgi:hypothetical protein|nr:hypothetical protein [Oscillospiraceae bacterium]